MVSATSEAASLEILLERIIGKSDTPAVKTTAHKFCRKYSVLQLSDKNHVLKQIAIKYSFNKDAAKKAAESLLSVHVYVSLFFSTKDLVTLPFLYDQETELLLKAADKLKNALTPSYNDAFIIIRNLECGVKFLVDLRADLLDILQEVDNNDNSVHYLKSLNSYLKDMLLASFNVGFLSLERITWESSCDMLQKISEYEAVHPVRNWTDLKQRVGLYRRCYAFTHSSMRKEPLVVLHTALTDDISSKISSIVTPRRMHSEGDIASTNVSVEHVENPDKIHAAVFYSITSTQKGLRGIELGNQLIKKVVGEVLKEFPHITKLSTLSPIPGFRDWLLIEMRKIIENGESVLSSFFSKQDLSSVGNAINETNDISIFEALSQLINNNRWINSGPLTDSLQLPLMKSCAHYVYNEKRRSYALNGVAHFHLRNGAELWRLNWMADLSPRGLTNSCGIMANYRYYIEETEKNSRKYIENFEIPISDNVKHLLMRSSL